MNFINAPSPNFDDRRDGQPPALIVLHFTAGKSAEHALQTLTDGNRTPRVSSHYMIDEQGKVFRLVPEEKRAWHAGAGYWNGSTDVNTASIGIEISNRDHAPYPPEQIAALVSLCHDLQGRYNIPAYNVIGHSDLAPDRKDDPGYHFPWAALAREGIGVTPKPKLRDHFRASAIARNPRKLQKLFAKAGYKADNLEKLVAAFQQHYEPQVYTAPKRGEQPGKATASTVKKLRALARHNKKQQNRR